jgi:HD-GYP domain-containing protein (c-di-GMP phosphodiesterase class II)
MALPNDDFTVSYKVNVDASLSGNQIIDGTFAYIQDNETEKFIIPKDIISIQADQSEAAQRAAMDKILAEQQAKEDAAEAARQEAAPAEEVAEETTEEVIEETAEEVVETSEEVVEEVAEVAEEVAETTEEVVEEVAEEVVETAEEAVEEVADKVAEEAPVVEEAPNYNDSMMKSKPGLVFRVQVAAGPNQVDPNFFKNKYGLSDAVVLEEHEGLYKYIVGEFGSYRPAKTFSNELRDSNGVVGPFVTAYNDGVRIHVKEALEIAGQ